MQQFDCIVIGGGIIGLSTAWAVLAKSPNLRLAVIEKENSWARHQTGRNSGVIHSGIYYKPGSLKAKLCRDGNKRLVQFCQTHGIRYEACGKVIVATTAAELPLLENLYGRGIANGLAVRKLSAAEVKEIEPHVSCLTGIHVPSTGIVDFVGICRKLAELVQARGCALRLGTKVQALRANGTGAIVETDKGELAARWIINCAGLHSDRVAKLGGADPGARIVPFRGEYYELPEIREDDLLPGAAGVRAQALRPDGGLVDDFLIINSPSAIHVCNAPSPAATASLEIGRVIAEQIPCRTAIHS